MTVPKAHHSSLATLAIFECTAVGSNYVFAAAHSSRRSEKGHSVAAWKAAGDRSHTDAVAAQGSVGSHTGVEEAEDCSAAAAGSRTEAGAEDAHREVAVGRKKHWTASPASTHTDRPWVRSSLARSIPNRHSDHTEREDTAPALD